MEAGIYKAKPKSWGIGTTKDGNPKCIINFILENQVEMTWEGSLKEGRAQEITLDALLACGYQENDFNVFANGKGLDVANMVNLTVENDEYEGKTRLKIKWVNSINQGKETLAANEAVIKLSGLNLEASLMARRQKLGIMKKVINPEINADNIPF